VAGTCEYGNEPSGSINVDNFLTKLKPVSFSRRIVLHGVSKYYLSDWTRHSKCPSLVIRGNVYSEY